MPPSMPRRPTVAAPTMPARGHTRPAAAVCAMALMLAIGMATPVADSPVWRACRERQPPFCADRLLLLFHRPRLEVSDTNRGGATGRSPARGTHQAPKGRAASHNRPAACTKAQPRATESNREQPRATESNRELRVAALCSLRSPREVSRCACTVHEPKIPVSNARLQRPWPCD